MLPAVLPVRHRRTARLDIALDATLAAIVERGYDRVRFRDVASGSGMSIGNLQHLFGTRELMLMRAFVEGAERDLATLAAIATSPSDRREQLETSLADCTTGLGARAIVRIELWRAGLRDAEIAAGADVIASRWREHLLAIVPRDLIAALLVDAGVIPPRRIRGLAVSTRPPPLGHAPLVHGHEAAASSSRVTPGPSSRRTATSRVARSTRGDPHA
jgi:AcrR family transcriptional regulator